MSDADDDRDYSTYDSGPFCRHWIDPSGCDQLCATCGHRCVMHNLGDGESGCEEDGCECLVWKDDE